jgi:hypothetical protein
MLDISLRSNGYSVPDLFAAEGVDSPSIPLDKDDHSCLLESKKDVLAAFTKLTFLLQISSLKNLVLLKYYLGNTDFKPPIKCNLFHGLVLRRS